MNCSNLVPQSLGASAWERKAAGAPGLGTEDPTARLKGAGLRRRMGLGLRGGEVFLEEGVMESGV